MRVKEKGREQDGDRDGWRETGTETERRGTHKGIKVLRSGFEEISMDSTRLDMTIHHLKQRREERRRKLLVSYVDDFCFASSFVTINCSGNLDS